MTANKVSSNRIVGDIVAIPLGDGSYGYGRILKEPLIAFYGVRTKSIVDFNEVLAHPIAFIVYVMNNPIVSGMWPVIGHKELEPELLDEPAFFKKDPISGRFSIYRDNAGEEVPAFREECIGLERASVWDSSHIVDRLVDLFEGRPNKWLTSMQP